LVRKGGHFVVKDFVAFARGEADDALASGHFFLRQPILNKLPADLNHLCDLVERLSGLFIMAYRVHYRGIVHNVTLPRSWFIILLRPLPSPEKHTSALLPFTRTIMDLMQRIDKQVESPPQLGHVDQFRADGRRVTNITGPFYIARICLCLCLLGFNTNDDRYKDEILGSIRSLSKGLEWNSTPSIYRRYVHAKNWSDLEYALTESLKYTSLDEMILLLHDSITAPLGRRWNHVRPVVYSRLDEVPRLLLADPSTTGTITHQQRPRDGTETGGDHDGRGQPMNVVQERIAEENEAEEAPGSGGDHNEGIDERLVRAAKVIQNAYRRHLERRRDEAAKKIQMAYLRYLKRKKVVRKGLDATQARYWQLLHEKSMEMEWTKDSRYHLLFRVPLAYILVCLDVVGGFVESRKNEAKKRLKTEGDKDLEDVMDAIQQSSKLLKRIIELQKKLSPSSGFHKGKSGSDLQRVVLEVKVVVESLEDIPESIGTRNKIGKRLERGYKWIFEKQGGKAKGKKVDKPKLVLDREDLMYL